MGLSDAQRQKAFITRLKIGAAPTPQPRKPVDRRTKPQRWKDAIAELESLLDGCQRARDNLPDHLTDSAYVEKLDAVLEHVEVLAEADLPLGFGRD
jgi:hypothetical protein